MSLATQRGGFILCLDTALAHCQAALVTADGATTRGASGGAAAGDAEAIVAHSEAALRSAGVGFADLTRIAVTVGPGSFTGVRVGIAYAKGLALALRIEAVGVSTLEVIAHQSGEGPVLASLDARHGAVYAALYGAPIALEPCRIAASDALALAHEAGARIVGDDGAVRALGIGERFERLDLATLARRAGARPPAPQAEHASSLRPLYLAEADARPQTHKSLARA